MRVITGSADARGSLPGSQARPRAAPRTALAGGLGVLSLSLLSACGTLWRPYLDSLICDPSGTRCIESGAERVRLRPSNGIDPAWFGEAKAELQPAEDLVVDTDLGTIVTAKDQQPLADVVFHDIAPVDCGGGWQVGIGVFSFLQIKIPDGIRVRVTGARALALIAPGPIKIEGLLDLQAGQAECSDARCAGPGGFAGSSVRVAAMRGDGPGGGGWGFAGGTALNESGAGGAGSCGSGGKGGDSGITEVGGAGGQPYQQPTLVPLCGGSGGGAGGAGTQTGETGQRGGGGGGAIQIVSQTSVLIGSTSPATASGISAGGGGGQGDHGMNFNDGGGGGGSGGAILIEAPRIAIDSDAVLAVNGGGGGGGRNGTVDTNNGAPGSLSVMPAAGGAGERSGGNGGAADTPNGRDASGSIGDGGAGGGGGAGRIRLNTLDGTITLRGQLSPVEGSCTSTGQASRP